MKRPRASPDAGAALLAAGLLAVCCAGPLLLAAVATTGLGAMILAQGVASLSAATLLVAASLGVVWLRHRGSAASARGGCCAPAGTAQEQPK